MATKLGIRLGEYEDRICSELCYYHKMVKEMEFPNRAKDWKWDHLFRNKCSVDCPSVAAFNIIREEDREYAELELEAV